jgi:hypothetical protein
MYIKATKMRTNFDLLEKAWIYGRAPAKARDVKKAKITPIITNEEALQLIAEVQRAAELKAARVAREKELEAILREEERQDLNVGGQRRRIGCRRWLD